MDLITANTNTIFGFKGTRNTRSVLNSKCTRPKQVLGWKYISHFTKNIFISNKNKNIHFLYIKIITKYTTIYMLYYLHTNITGYRWCNGPAWSTMLTATLKFSFNIKHGFILYLQEYNGAIFGEKGYFRWNRSDITVPMLTFFCVSKIFQIFYFAP